MVSPLMMISLTRSPLKFVQYSTLTPASQVGIVSLKTSISNYDLLNTIVSSTTVINALDQLKKGKSDGSNLISDAFIFAIDILSDPPE